MRLTVLGSSAGVPVPARNVSAYALRFANGAIWMVDCGEATQHQMQRSGLRAARVERILLTHLHGDHCFGLWGMLAAIAVAGRREPVQVAGPPGVAELIGTVHRVCAVELPFPLRVVEVEEGHWRQVLPAEGLRAGAWSAEPWPISHRVPCLAWVLREPPPRGAFDRERAEVLGVPNGPLRGRLQCGESVVLADGRVVRPEEVCHPARPARVVAVCGDTDDADALLPGIAGCDLLVREVTYEAGREEHARRWGHSTAAMTGAFAARAGAKRLLATHFSARYTVEGDGLTIDQLMKQVAGAAPGVQVIAAHDLITVEVPPSAGADP